MKKLSAVINSLTFVLLTLVSLSSSAQLVGDNAFLQGRYVEAGVASNGSMGSNRIVPSGYHTRSPSFNFYDPGLGAFSGASASRLMMTYDAGHDGWTTGIPTGFGFFGDYSMPGTPYEGWSVSINGVRGDANFQSFLGTSTGYTLALPVTGTVTGYTNASGTMTGTWQGTAGTGAPLSIKQVFVLDTNASWVRVNVTLKNVSSSALTGVYYMRHCDPDNDQYISGNFNTLNTINYQNDYYHRVMVTAAGTYFTTQTLSLMTKDCRAKCFSAPSWPANSSVTLASYYAGTASTCIYTGSHTGDYAIGLVWNLGNIAAGDSTVLTFAYVYNGLLGMDSAVASPKISVNGALKDSVDTVTACAFTGDTLWANVVNGSSADWTGSTWTWAPSTYLLTTTGVSNGILASTMTAPVTYTVTGTPAFGGCGNKIFLLTVMPPGVTPTPTVHDTSFCQGAPTGPITACATGIGTVMWFTSPTGGVGTPVAPTPSTSTPGTYTWYVSQVVAGCSSARVPVNVFVVTPAPPITGPSDVCTGNCITVSNTTAGGTWASSNTAVGTVGSLTGIVCGVSAGTTTIDYMLGGSGCMVSTIVTVNQTPPAITGTVNVCATFTATLSNTLTGGTWSSGGPGVTFGTPTSGVVTGVLGGPTTVTYTMPTGCYITRTQSVIPLPNPITGNTTLCIGTCSSLSSTSAGGIWSSGLPASGTPATSIATVGAATGNACGISIGTATISYRINGCPTTTIVSVIATPPAIGGTLSVCAGSTTTLTHPSSGGTWSIAPASVATISSGGVVTGNSAVVTVSTATVTYSLGGSCSATAVVTVNPNPGPISGSGTICIGNTTTLTHATAGGTWVIGTPSTSGVPTAVATLASPGAGIVTGVATGTATLSYVIPGGCVLTTVINVISTPSGITGSLSACSGGTSSLTSASSGGTWTSSSTGVATITSTGGVVTAGGAGTSTISYTIGGCSTTAVFTTNPNPGAITPGAAIVCSGATVSLGSTPGGGTWSTASSNITVDATTGVVTGGAPAGTATVTYTMAGGTGCYTTTTVTVNASPSAIAGATSLCLSGVSTLSSTPAGGTWSSTTPSVASVSATGVVTASSSATGTSTISYSVSGCPAFVVVTVNANPSISGLLQVCAGATRSLTTSIPGGTWSMACPATATIDATTGVVSGVASGTCIVTYTAPGGCSSTATVTVNAAPSAIVGGPSVCMGAPTLMSSTPAGGTWAASGSASIGLTSGILTGSSVGTAIVTYTTPLTFCATTLVVSVVAAPAAISGPLAVCVASTTTLTNSASGGTWTIGLPSTSGTPTSIATVNPTTGAVAGITAGTATVTYNIGSSCVATAVVTVNPLPLPISGPLSLCLGMTGTLTSSVNAWSSSNPSVAPIIAGTGVITGVSLGTTIITDSLPTGCRVTAVVTVNGAPGAIGGSLSVCIGQSTTLSNSTSGGTWSMACPTIGSINSSTGVVSGIASGTCYVTYTAPTGCSVMGIVTVNALPTTISGPSSVCVNSTVTMSSSPAGGTWSITPAGTASVTTTTGYVTGIASGPATLTYTVGSGCYITTTINVNAGPSPITGPVATCVGSCAALGGSPAGGTWSIAPTAIATVSPTGNVCGVAFGTAIVTYTLSNGCSATQVMTVNNLPGPISGSGIACTGSATPYTNATSGGSWSISPLTVATVNATTGDVTGVIGATAGSTATLTYTIGTGCSVTTVITLNASPAPITGTAAVCALGTTTLSSSPAGGTWIGAPCASINPSTGVVTAGGSACTGTISYMLSSGCAATTIVSVNPLPSSIGGTLTVCQGGTATLSGSPAGGTWSIAPTTVASVVGTSSGAWYGVVTGSTAPATATVTYTMPATGCFITAVATVTPLPAPITGSLYIAMGGTTSLSSSPSGGTWSSSTPLVASVVPPATSGVIQGNNLGTSTIIYTNGGCSTNVVVTVQSAPVITGSLNVCETFTTSLSSTVGGGVWSSTNLFSATVDPTTGVVTGVNAGTSTISYVITSTGITTTAVVTVHALPSAISGPASVCAGSSISLSTASTTGTWSSSNTAAATISSAGVVSGIAGYGTTTIRYTLPSGCYVSHVVAVDSLPSAITGSSGFCNFTSSVYSASPTGGSWFSTNTAVATIDPTTGIATGVSVDSVTIVYTSAAGCSRSKQIDIIFGPAAITGPDHVCEGSTVTLGNSITGGTWSSSTPAVGTVGLTSGVVGGIAAGTTIISYKLSISSCTSTLIVTVDQTPGAIFGVPVVCEGSTTTLFNTMSGGSWSSGNLAIASVDAGTGVVTGVAGGTVLITYTSLAGCSTAALVTVNALPSAIAGSLSICVGTTSSLSSSPSGGSWWNSGTALTTGFSTGVATGMSVGTGTVTYTLPTGCFITAVATVFPVPSGNSGPSSVCQGATITLVNTTGGGIWVSSNPANASVDPMTGVVTGILPGTSNIVYQMPSGCSATTTVTVNTTPIVTGALQVCAGFNTNLIGTPSGGNWTTTPGTHLIGTVNPLSGVVTGISGGNTGITYTLPFSGCHVEYVVTVNNLPPAIGGIPTVCVGGTTTLTNFDPGGTWSSSNIALATVDPVTGIVSGVSTGTVDITYTIVTGCINTRIVTVNPLPAPIVGMASICADGVTTFTDATLGGTWSSASTSVATVAPMGPGIGAVHGVASGTVAISYTLPTGCYVTKDVTVNVTPPAIVGSGHICVGSTRLLTNAMSGGVWISSNPSVAPVSATGVVSGSMLGTSIIAYTLPGSGCAASRMVTVQPLPTVYTVTGGGSYCAGGTGVNVGLSGSQIGVSYALYYGSSATGYLTGTNLPLNFGLMTLGGVYTVQATNPVTGCTSNMAGSTTVTITTPSVPTVSINSVPGDTVCPGSMATVSPIATHGGSAPTYVWKVNGVTVSTAPAYSFIPADGDLVGVTMTSNSGCVLPSTASAEKVLHVAPTMMPAVAAIVDPGDTVCQYSLVTYMANPSYGGSAPTYAWLVNGVVAGAGPVFSYVPNDGDAIKVRMTSNYICRLTDVVESGTVAMVVDSMIVPHIHVTPHPGYAVDSGTTVTFSTVVTDAGPSPTYQWYINGVPVMGETNDSFVTNSLNHYDSVACRVTSSGVCHDVSSYDWAFISVSPVGVQHINVAADIRLIPNPNNGTFTIKGTWGSTDEDITLEVTNMIGQVVYSGKVTARNGKVNESVHLNNTLANGMYMLNMRTANDAKVFHFVMEQQ